MPQSNSYEAFGYLTAKRIKEVFSNIPEIETERLILKKISLSDRDDMFEYSKSSEVTRYLTWLPHSSVKETEHYIKILEKKYACGDFYDWGLHYKADGRFIGTCGFTSFSMADNCAEIGYVISPGYQRMGLAPEAAIAVMRFGFAVFNLSKIEARFIDGNEASCQVMKKCGMTFEGIYRNSMFIKGEYKTIQAYVISRETFLSRYI